ncbi:MAG: hypothetical protein SPI74_00590 [Eubacterium sp.]|nr:hypothetical protein [Eubacterium sp.]
MKTIKRITAILFGIAINLLLVSASYAADVSWQVRNAAILSNNSVAGDGFRYVGWGITKLFAGLGDIAESLYNKTFGMIDVTKYPAIEALIKQFYPVLVALIVLCIVGLGISYIILQAKKPIVRNILLVGLVLSSSVYMFTTANGLISSFKSAVLDEGNKSSVYEIVNNNLIDLVGVDKAGNISGLDYSKGKGIVHNSDIKNRNSMNAIDINEVINYSDKDSGQKLYGWSDAFNEYMKYKAININGKYVPEEIYDGVLSTTIGNNFYYRYSFDFWTAFLELATIILLYFAMAYKNVRIAYELVVSRFMAFFFATDIGNGERLKQILYFIRDTYIALCISIMSIKIFLIMTEAMPSLGITGLTKGIVSLFIAFVVIDGPNLSERVLGIDAGLNSSFARTMAIFGMARTAANFGRSGVKSAASSAGKTAMAAKTGKTAQERKQDSNYASMGERIGKKINSKFEGKKENKSDEKGSGEKSAYKEQSFMNEGKANANDKVENLATSSKVGSGYAATAFMNDGKTSKTNQNDFVSSNSLNSKTEGATKEAQMGKTRYTNPEFAKKVKELAPGKDASAGERRDFNRQVNNIVRGDHKAIKPDEKSRAEYKETNYIKAQTLERAYHSKEGDKDGSK